MRKVKLLVLFILSLFPFFEEGLLSNDGMLRLPNQPLLNPFFLSLPFHQILTLLLCVGREEGELASTRRLVVLERSLELA